MPQSARRRQRRWVRIQVHREVPVNKWLRRIRGAVGICIVWAAVWAAAGTLTGKLVDPDGSMDGIWLGPAIGVQPGLLGGVVFSAVLGIAAPGRRLHELSLSQVGAWGAMAGLLVGVLPFAINQPPSEFPLWLVGAAVVGSMTLLGSVTAAVCLALARRAGPAARPTAPAVTR